MSKQEDLTSSQYIKMTQQPISSLLVSLSIPTVISMMVTNIYNLVDTAFVGTISTSASAATGIVLGYMAILQAIGFLCGQGAGSVMARHLGAKDLDGASRYTSAGFFMSFSLGALVALISGLFIDPLIEFLGSTPTIAPHAKTYILFMLISAPFFTASLTMNNLLRYEGRAKLGTIGLMIGAVLNIGGDALFIKGMNMEIFGAGLSTAISQTVSFVILLFMFIRKRTQTDIALHHIKSPGKTISNVFTTGFPSLLRQGLNSVATMMQNRCAKPFGDSAIAAMSVVGRICFFTVAIALGIGQGFQPISSFNYGAKKYNRVRDAYKTALISSTLVLMFLSIPVFIFAEPLIRIMRDDDEVVQYGIRALRLLSVSNVFVPLTMLTEMGFQSTGKKILASFASSLRSGLLFIPILLILSKLRGMSGIQEAQPLGYVCTFIICIFLSRYFINSLKEKEQAL